MLGLALLNNLFLKTVLDSDFLISFSSLSRAFQSKIVDEKKDFLFGRVLTSSKVAAFLVPIYMPNLNYSLKKAL